MSTTTNVSSRFAEQRAVMHHVSWETYEGLLEANRDAGAPRITYDHGVLEITSPSSKHEDLKISTSSVVDIIAEEWEVEFKALGSTTFRRQEIEQGLEPDCCYYIQHVERIRGKEEIDLSIDPPPDLVIEIEISTPALSKLPVYARLGVPKILLADGLTVRILQLAADHYEDTGQSQVLKSLNADVLTALLRQSRELKTLEWRRMVREWAREHRR